MLFNGCPLLTSRPPARSALCLGTTETEANDRPPAAPPKPREARLGSGACRPTNHALPHFPCSHDKAMPCAPINREETEGKRGEKKEKPRQKERERPERKREKENKGEKLERDEPKKGERKKETPKPTENKRKKELKNKEKEGSGESVPNHLEQQRHRWEPPTSTAAPSASTASKPSSPPRQVCFLPLNF